MPRKCARQVRTRFAAIAYVALFLTAFVAATLLPAQSEAALAGLLVAGEHPVVVLVLVATAGNVLGSLVNWLIGRGVETFRDRRWFPVRPAALERAQRWYRRYGKWSLLLSWLPIVGDALPLAAGAMREPLVPVAVLVTLAKLGRYVVLAALVLRWA